MITYNELIIYIYITNILVNLIRVGNDLERNYLFTDPQIIIKC